MIRRSLVVLSTLSSSLAANPWQLALPGWEYHFPRDHEQHPAFKTEWWYFTGNLTDERGSRLGYQVTFFRDGIRPPMDRHGTTSRFIVDDLKFAHFAVSDPQSRTFRFFQKSSRGAFGEAGFSGPGGSIAWIDDWKLTTDASNGWRLDAKAAGASVALMLSPAKPLVIHGNRGVSQKADGAGHASHYYSSTRLKTSGAFAVNGHTATVTGNSWFDHEWGSNQLTVDQVGWDWLSVAFDDNTELMLYRLRLRNGGVDPNSSATYVNTDGHAQHLTNGEFSFTPRRWWTSSSTGGRYPVRWSVELPGFGLNLTVDTPLQEQELVVSPVAYWEGMINANGDRNGRKVRGNGYLELTGYSGALVGLRQ